MTSALDITFLSTAMGLGGADRQVLLLSRELDRRGHSVRIISVVPDGQMADDARESGIPVSSLRVESTLDGVLSVPNLRRQAGEADVVHAHMFHANLLARVSRPLLQTKAVVSTIHNVYESTAAYHQPHQKTPRNRLYELTDRLSDCTTCVCQAAVERYSRLGVVRGETEVVYNGIDGEAFRPTTTPQSSGREGYCTADSFVWLTVGRFFEMKDYPNLVRAFARTSSPDTVLWVVGHGEDEATIKRLTRDLDIDDRVRVLGTVDDISAVMAAADGFVLGSRWEGFPMVLLEAQASGLPVVATRVGGIPELVADGQTGVLVPSEESAALAEAMDTIVEMDVDARAEMGRRGRERTVERFGIESITDRWVEIYRRLLDS